MSFRCPKRDCGQVFATDKARKKHCVVANDHEFCKKCDYMAKDWDDLTLHKANSPIVHLCCKFCGEDFKTPSGRDRHIKQFHPVDQDIRCIGCDEHFVRAAALIEHLEFNHCPKITAQQFKSNIQHKFMVSKILNDPVGMSSKLFDFSVTDNDSSGGVALSQSAKSTLLDEEDKDNANPPESLTRGSVIKPLKPEVKPRDPNAPRVDERWPTLPSHSRNVSSSTDLDGSMARMSISGSSGGARLPSGIPSVKGPPSPSSPSSASTFKPVSQAWTGSSASAALFPGAQQTPLSHEWEAALKAREVEYELANSTNILMHRYWDPTHQDYDPERFYNPVIEMYSCPFPQCDDNYPEPFMLEYHINTIHSITQQRCPQCLKLFKSTTALVAHCEAPTSECSISRTDRYGQAIDQFSGGFLGATDARRPDFTDADREDRYVDKNMEKKQYGSGYRVGMIKYESTLPLDWPSEVQSNIQIGRPWDDSSSRGNTRGSVNPAVPLSKSRKEHHSTASIYPQPYQDYIPEITDKTFALPREERERRQAQPSSVIPCAWSTKESDASSTAQQKKAKANKTKRSENLAPRLIDPEHYNKKIYGKDMLQQTPDQVMTPMRRQDAYYMSGEQPDEDGASVSASSSIRRSAWGQ